jgi:quercetin dioxygenase-like cupin family protein
MTSSIFISDVNDLPLRTPPIPGIPVKVLLGASNCRTMQAGLMSWSPGAKSQTQPHYHSVEEFQLVVAGHATLNDCNGDKHPLRPGTMFLCPAGEDGVHGVHNTSDLAMTLLFLYPQQDFETVKMDAVPGKRLKSTILMRETEDIKAEAAVTQGTRKKRLCGPSDSVYVSAEIAWCDPGASLTRGQVHYHSTEEFQFVLHGRAEITDGDGRKSVLREGMMAVCAAGDGGAHGIGNNSDFPACLLIVHPVHQYETKEHLAR